MHAARRMAVAFRRRRASPDAIVLIALLGGGLALLAVFGFAPRELPAGPAAPSRTARALHSRCPRSTGSRPQVISRMPTIALTT